MTPSRIPQSPRLSTGLVAVFGCLLAAGAGGVLLAQATWDARLAIAAFPSPYLSDWEANPTIATLTITNPTAADHEVLLVYQVRDARGRELASGRSDPQLILTGPPTVLTDFVTMSGRSSHDAALEQQMRRTGRLPEGEHLVCVTVTDRGGFILAEDCASFTIVYPAPPDLIAPFDAEAIATGHPVLQWTPLGVPPIYQVSYVVRISEVLSGQVPAQALAANIPVYEGTTSTSLVDYPPGARPLEPGRTYAWQVQALDQHGYAATAAEGRSEIRTFRYEPAGTGTAGATPVQFTLFNAYDQGAGEVELASTPSPPTSYDIKQICSQWDAAPPDQLELGVNSPFGFVGFHADQAFLYRETDPDNRSLPRQWWVFAQTDRGRSILMSGNCNGRTFGLQLSGLQWIAWRKYGRAQKINDFIDGLTANGTDLGLEFGLFVVALDGMGTVSAPAEFLQGSSFLEGHEFDVRRGLNLYAVVQLPEGPVWEALQALGYDRNQVTLQGFAGMDVSKAVGVGGNDGFEATASRERTFLFASASFPERAAIGPLGVLAESMQWSLEFELQDSLGVNLQAGDSGGTRSQSSYSKDYVYRLKHTINLRQDLFPRGSESRALVGWIGFDQAGGRDTRTPGRTDVREHAADRLEGLKRALTRGSGGRLSGILGDTSSAMRCQPKKELEWKTDLVINYGLEGKLYTVGPVFLEDPALELHVGQKMANGQREMAVGFAAGIGVDGYAQQGVIGISRTRELSDDELADPTCRPTRPRANADADPTTPSSRTPTTMPPSDAGTPLNAPWKWSWKAAWEVAPVGALGKAVNGGLAAMFILIGLGGG